MCWFNSFTSRYFGGTSLRKTLRLERTAIFFSCTSLEIFDELNHQSRQCLDQLAFCGLPNCVSMFLIALLRPIPLLSPSSLPPFAGVLLTCTHLLLSSFPPPPHPFILLPHCSWFSLLVRLTISFLHLYFFPPCFSSFPPFPSHIP